MGLTRFEFKMRSDGYHIFHKGPELLQWQQPYQLFRQASNIRRTLAGNYIHGHSDEVGASPVGAAPTAS